jgi:spore germination protein
MSKRFYYILIVVTIVTGLLQGCGDPITSRAKSRGTSTVRNWLKYEFRQLKTFSYGNSQIKENQHVIGYEPSWLIYDSLYLNYPFQLLSDLVIGEYDLNPITGFARNDSAINAFRNKDIIELGTGVNEELNVLLALTDYSDIPYRPQFLAEVPKKNLMNSLDLILNEFNERRGGGPERDKVGILVDFPNVAWNHRYDFAEFLARIKKDLNNKELGKSCLLYLVLPPGEEQYVLYKDSVFAAKVRQSVDLFVLRTHSFDSPILPDANGNMMPIDRPGEMLDVDSVVHYYNKKAKIPLSKITLEVPYYSTVWSDSGMSGQRPMIPVNEMFNTVVSPRLLDTMSMAFKYKLDDTTIYYYQDTLSLNIFYDWVVRNKLGGIGIYGLGYGQGIDNASMEDGLWQIIASNFGEPAPRLLFPGVGFLLCFFGVGLVVSVVNNWEVRYALRAKRTKLWYYIALLFFILFAVVMCALPIEVVPIMWKLISLAILLIFPLGRKAFRYFFAAAR